MPPSSGSSSPCTSLSDYLFFLQNTWIFINIPQDIYIYIYIYIYI
jgi:hypothetical protein